MPPENSWGTRRRGCRFGDPHPLEELDRAILRHSAAHPPVQDQRLGDLAADPRDRTLRRHGLLEDQAVSQ
jgi:hypothetical protein